MWLKLTNDRASLFGPRSPDEMTWLRSFLTFGDAEAKGDPRAKEQVSLYNVFDNSFPAGMLDLVKREAKKTGTIKVEVADARDVPCAPIPLESVQASLAEFGAELRAYQCDAIRAALRSVRGILQLPTGAGKTTIAVALIESLPTRWLFVVNSADLVDQGAKRYRSLTGKECGVIAEGKYSTGTVTFATFQSLLAKRDAPAVQEYLRSVRAVMVDEAHTVAADTFFDVLGMLPNAYYRFGLSGTPLSRSDRKSILAVAQIGSVIYKITPGELTKLGYLSEPRITLLEVSQRGAYDEHFSRFRKKYIVQSRRRNAAVLEAVEKVAKPALVFVKEVDHGRALVKEIEALGVSCALVWGEKTVEQRGQAIKALERRDIEVIVCSSVFTTGVDIPFLEGGVNAAGGKSVIDTLQRLGRGLRVTADKKTFDWFDIADTGNRWLADHTKDREAAYKQAGYTTRRVPSLRAQAIPDMDAKKGKERLTSAKQVQWTTAGLEDLLGEE